MKTQVSIKVNNENIVSRFFSLMWIINIFKKMPVDMVLDDPNAQPTRMKARKEPYVIDVEPGGHAMLFTDPRAGGKAAFKAVTGAFLGAAVAGAGGGSMLSGAVIGAGTGKSDLKHGYLEFNVNEGDILKISVKPLRSGNVKIKLIKD